MAQWCLCLMLASLIVPIVGAQEKKTKSKKDLDVPDGLKALQHPDPAVRYKAVALLAKLGPVAKFALDDLRQTLKDANGFVRVKAAEALWRIDSKTPANVLLPVLTAALKDKNPELRAAAAPVLGLLGSKARSAVPALIDATKDKDEGVRVEAVLALGEIGPAAKDAAPHLLALVPEEMFSLIDPMVVTALGNMGAGVVPDLEKAVRGGGSNRCVVALQAIGLVGKEAKDAVPTVADALGDSHRLVREYAAKALGKIGPDAAPAVPKLEKALKDKTVAVQMAAGLALYQIAGRKEGIPVFSAALAEETVSSRVDACRAIGTLGKDAVPALRDLSKALADKESEVRLAATEALGRIGPESKPVGDKLLPCLKDEELAVALAAGFAYWQIVGDNKPSLDVLVSGVKQGRDPRLAHAAVDYLGAMGKSARAAIPVLSEYLEDDDDVLRGKVRAALQRIDGK
ncbi:MAG: HEAT repeat domain-containing protein [Gemmataceae bacterium]|nr:HEAT repeat domain-containing protein [Gemmataceae bacterium]MCI0737986.1 HEAT repeat domain-containing protein [Gemmataceae bacterium]